MFNDGLNKATKLIRMHGRLSDFGFEFEISKMQYLIWKPCLNLRTSNAISVLVQFCFIVFRTQRKGSSEIFALLDYSPPPQFGSSVATLSGLANKLMKTKPKMLKTKALKQLRRLVNEIFKRNDARREKCDGAVFVALN